MNLSSCDGIFGMSMHLLSCGKQGSGMALVVTLAFMDKKRPDRMQNKKWERKSRISISSISDAVLQQLS